MVSTSSTQFCKQHMRANLVAYPLLVGNAAHTTAVQYTLHCSTYYTRGIKLTDVEEKRGVHHINENTAGDLSRTRELIFQNLHSLTPAPNAYLNEGGFAPGLQYLWDYPQEYTTVVPPDMQVRGTVKGHANVLRAASNTPDVSSLRMSGVLKGGQ